jgi:hypothetical protein
MLYELTELHECVICEEIVCEYARLISEGDKILQELNETVVYSSYCIR